MVPAGIHNAGEFYSHHYLDAVLSSDLKHVFQQWKRRAMDGGAKEPQRALDGLANPWFDARAAVDEAIEPQDRLRAMNGFHLRLLAALGFEPRPDVAALDDGTYLPLLHRADRDGEPHLWVIEAAIPRRSDDDPLEAWPLEAQIPVSSTVDPSELAMKSWRRLLDEDVFRQERPPRWVLALTGEDVYLIDRHKWGQGRHLRFELAVLFARRETDALKATAGLLHRDVLHPGDGLPVHDTLDENSHKHAYAVSTDLKLGARVAIELLGNEVVWFKRNKAKERVYDLDGFDKQLTHDCVTYLYRLLFLFSTGLLWKVSSNLASMAFARGLCSSFGASFFTTCSGSDIFS